MFVCLLFGKNIFQYQKNAYYLSRLKQFCPVKKKPGCGQLGQMDNWPTPGHGMKIERESEKGLFLPGHGMKMEREGERKKCVCYGMKIEKGT